MAAFLTASAAVAYALGWVCGKGVAYALWLWQAAKHGYKDGL